MACRSLRRSRSDRDRDSEVDSRLADLDLCSDTAPAPAGLDFYLPNKFRFTSPLLTAWETNNTVYGKFYPCQEHWTERPTVILLHGWNAELGYRYLFPWFTKHLIRSRINAAMIELPYHGQRKPWDNGIGLNFLSEDLARTLEAARQAVTDVRALLGWFISQGCPNVGLWGFSLGAWLGGLVACADPRTRFAILLTPVVQMERAIQELDFCEPLREKLKHSGLRLDRLNLVAQQPKIPREDILFVQAQHDLFAPSETIEELWRAWDHPEIWRVQHGHISALVSASILQRTVRWIARKTTQVAREPVTS